MVSFFSIRVAIYYYFHLSFLYLASLAIFLPMGWGHTAENNDEIKNSFEKAVEYFKKSDFNQSVNLLKNTKQSQPELFKLNNGDYILARALEKSDQYSE